MSEQRNRLPTDLIPVNQMSGQWIQGRTVQMRALDHAANSDFSAEIGTSPLSIDIRDTAFLCVDDFQGTSTAIPLFFGSGVGIIKQIQKAFYGVNRRAVRALIRFSQIADQGTDSVWYDSFQCGLQDSRLAPMRVEEKEKIENEAPGFYEPIEFEWTEQAHKMRQAAKAYSEKTNADY